MKSIGTILMFLCLILPSLDARSEVSEGGILVPKRIAIMPIRITPDTNTDLFTPVSRQAELEARAQINRALKQQPELETRDWSEIKKQLEKSAGFKDALRVMDANIALGIDQYRNLRVDEAVKTLERARLWMHEKLIDLYDPKMASKLYLNLGICLVEQGKIDAARMAFARMFYYEPNRRFEKGFHPPNIEKTLISAISILNASMPIGAPSMEISFLKKLKKKTKLDQVVTLLLRGADSPNIELRIYDLNRNMPSQFETLTHTLEKGVDPDALNRFLSRYIACEVFDRLTPSAFKKRYNKNSIETYTGYHTYARTPSRDIFHSMAAGIRAGRGTGKNFALFADLSILSSFQDRHRDLANRLVSLRMILGADFRTQWRRLTFSLSPGLETNLIPDFTVYTSSNCKFFGATHPLCQPKNIKAMKSGALVGLNGSFGVRYNPTKSLFLALRASVGVYLLPANINKELDFPLTVTLGLGFNL